jgi:transcription initiation factor IIE alpha subunit
MGKRKTIEQVALIFKKRGYLLLSTEYKNNNVNLEYLCPKRHRGKMSFGNFQQGHNCAECSGNKKWTIKQVKSFLKREGYSLLSTEYGGTHSKIRYICPKGHIGESTWRQFRRGTRCSSCAGNRKHTVEYVRDYFEKEGYRLLSNRYKGAHCCLYYKCPQGHFNWTTWTAFQGGNRCSSCAGNKPLTISQIRNAFKKERYILLSTEYKNNRSRLDYICPKGHQNQTTWARFQRGHRCPECNEYKGERRLKKILEQIYPSMTIRCQDSLGFLRRQRVDFSVRDLGLAFEYDGEQHFRPIRFKGMSENQAKQRFKRQRKWDIQKNELCEKNEYTLIRVAYYEDLTVENVKSKIKEKEQENLHESVGS